MPLDEVVERVETALDMWPDNLCIVFLLRDTAKGVQDIYRQRYGKECDYKAFISLGRLEIVLSVADASLKVLAHEIGHAIVERYFGKEKRPPYRIHELLAQYAEKHFSD
ncbi:MAG TPA: hypothetical protein DCZ63_15245 [Geobacter sp.]|nr:hypothetical protein [Geobacter sp.]